MKEIVDYRNYLSSRCFNEKLFNNQLNIIEEIDKFVDELNEFETIVSDFNGRLTMIFANKKIKRIWYKNNFTTR